MATVDLRTLPLSEQHHCLAFNTLGRTGRNPSDFLWICPTCNDGETHVPSCWTPGKGYYHVADGEDGWVDEHLHQLVAVDVLAVLESWRQTGFSIQSGRNPESLNLDHMLALGASPDAAALQGTHEPEEGQDGTA